MKRQSLVLLAVAFFAAGAAGCFKDPVSDLRNGPSRLDANFSNLILKAGDSVVVTAYLKDAGGNVLAETDAQWSSTAPAVASARKDTSLSAPGNSFTRGFIVAHDSANGGWTNVIVTSRGIADTIRVTVLPPVLTAAHVAFAGPTLTDSVISPANPFIPGDTAKKFQYTGPDTLILKGSSYLTFDTSQVTVSVSTTNGASPGLIVAKSPAQLTVVFETGTAGKVMVQHLVFDAGNAAVGAITIDTLLTGDSVGIAPWRIGPAAFGASAVASSGALTVTAGPGMTFGAGVTAGFGGAAGVVIGRTATSLTLLAPDAYTGPVTLFGVTLAADATVGGSVTIDSLQSTSGNFTLPAAEIPQANVTMSPNNGVMGDTIIVTAPTGMSFSTTGSVSRVLVGNRAVATSDTAWNVSVTASTIKAFAKRGGTGLVTATNLGLSSPPPGAVPFALSTPADLAIDSVTSDIALSQSQAGAVALTIPANDTAVVYGTALPGALNGGFAQSYWTFTTTATHNIYANAAWFGSGNPYGSGNNTTQFTEDLDLLMCNASTACDESAADLANFAGATTVQPQFFTVNSLPAAQYWINVAGFNVDYTIIYKLTVILQ